MHYQDTMLSPDAILLVHCLAFGRRSPLTCWRIAGKWATPGFSNWDRYQSLQLKSNIVSVICSLFTSSYIQHIAAPYYKSQLPGLCVDKIAWPRSKSSIAHLQRMRFMYLCTFMHVWEIHNGNLEPLLTTRDPAPVGLLELEHCRCKKSACRRVGCSCKISNLGCTDACFCFRCKDGCSNPHSRHTNDTEDNNDV